MSDVLADQFDRLLASLPAEAAARNAALEESGFLDLLAPEASGGGGMMLEDALPLGLALGKRLTPAPVLEQMLARALGATPETLPRPVAAAATAVLMAGAMQAVLEMTADYAGVRRQFGREIAKFQAVQHQIAVMAEEAMAANMAARIAFAGPPQAITPERAAIAKIRTGEAALAIAAGAHAVHGAIGMSEEHALQRYTAQLWRWRMAHGGESWWAEILGRHALAQNGECLEVVRSL